MTFSPTQLIYGPAIRLMFDRDPVMEKIAYACGDGLIALSLAPTLLGAAVNAAAPVIETAAASTTTEAALAAIGTTALATGANLVIQQHAHELNKDLKTHEHHLEKDRETHKYALQHRACIQSSRRESYLQLLKMLEAGHCGYIENPEQYRDYWKEVEVHHPTAAFSHGAQFRKCYDEALLQRG